MNPQATILALDAEIVKGRAWFRGLGLAALATNTKHSSFRVRAKPKGKSEREARAS